MTEQRYYIPPTIMIYGGAPDIATAPPRIEPVDYTKILVGNGTEALAKISLPAQERKLRVSALARDGKIKLMLSVDGVFLAEVEVEGTSVSLEEVLR